MKPARLLTDHLQRIRDTDAMAGDDLQTSPLAWQQRRELLGHVAALEEDAAAERQLVLELSTLLEPYSGGSMTLAQLVPRIRQMREIQGAVREEFCPHGYSRKELADGTVTCEGCTCWDVENCGRGGLRCPACKESQS